MPRLTKNISDPRAWGINMLSQEIASQVKIGLGVNQRGWSGSAIDVANYDSKMLYISAGSFPTMSRGVSSGAAVILDSAWSDEDMWYRIGSTIIVQPGKYTYMFSDPHPYIRARITGCRCPSGTYSVNLVAHGV